MKRNLITSIFSLLLTLSFAANASSPAEGNGIDTKNIDTTKSPRADFYLYANGNWIRNNPVPESESRWSSFDEVKVRNQQSLYEILQKLGNSKAKPGSATPPYVEVNQKLLATLFSSGMKAGESNQDIRTVIKPLYNEIDNVNDFRSLGKVLINLTLNGVNPMFSVYVSPDMNNSSVQALYLGQGGLSMPDRDYYLNEGEKFVTMRQAFTAHVAKTLVIFNETDDAQAAKYAESILAIEKDLASVSLPRTALRDPYKTNNPLMLDQLNQLSPEIDWVGFVHGLTRGQTDFVIVNNPDFFKHLSRMASSYSPDEWRMFLKWKVFRHVAPFLSDLYRKEHFAFNETVLKGIPDMPERWKSVLETINQYMGDALGQVYCESFYDDQADARMKTMIGNVKSAFRDRLGNLSWMSPETRKYAVMKLDSMTWKIGKPAVWRDYSSVVITDNYCANIINLSFFEMRRKLSQVGMPVDKSEWRISASTVNAYYSASLNEIVFPAGILQPPFFDKNADDAVIYGAIGAVIGHEIIHGFDDQGRKFDFRGNLLNWWTSADSAAFSKITSRIVDQYAAYTVNDDLKVNGKLTLGENIADIGGLAIAYQAFKYSQKIKPAPGKIDGFTPDQRFFLSFAQVWRMNVRPEEAARRILTDPHAPGKYRCNGTLSNMESFYAAFGVTDKDAMFRSAQDRVVIW